MTTHTSTLHRLDFQLSRTDYPTYAFMGVWVLSMITLPIIRWVWGEQIAIVWGVNATTLLQAGLVTFILARAWGIQRGLLTAASVVTLTLLVEWMGSSTNFPFGAYDYTNALQPQVAHVPVVIGFAWLMMLPSSWAVAYLLNGQVYGGWRFIALSAFAMTAWDLFLDPQMVSWGLWVWEPVGRWSYFGIPFVNYLGWLGTTATLTSLLRPRDLPILPLVIVYALVWALQSFGQLFFWGLIGPAVVGFFGMGGFVWIVFQQWRKEPPHA